MTGSQSNNGIGTAKAHTGIAVAGSNGLPVFSTPKADDQELAHGRDNDLFGFDTRVPLSLTHGGDSHDAGGVIRSPRCGDSPPRRERMGQAVIIIRTELTAAELRALAARS